MPSALQRSLHNCGKAELRIPRKRRLVSTGRGSDTPISVLQPQLQACRPSDMRTWLRAPGFRIRPYQSTPLNIINGKSVLFYIGKAGSELYSRDAIIIGYLIYGLL